MNRGILKILAQNLIVWGILWGVTEIGWDLVKLPWHIPLIAYGIFIIMQLGTVVYCNIVLNNEKKNK